MTTTTLPLRKLPKQEKPTCCATDTRSVQPLYRRRLTDSDDESLQNGMMSEPELLPLAPIETKRSQQPPRLQLTERYGALKTKAGPKLRDGKTTRFFKFSLRQLREDTPLNQHLSQA